MTSANTARFAGKTAIITGAGSGIGLETAKIMVEEGATVVGVDVSQERLDEAAKSLGDKFVTLAIDITLPDAAEQILAKAGEKVDILVNNAGIMDGFLPVVEVDDQTWELVLAVNVTAPMRLSRAVLPGMIETGGGAIVNVSSEASLRTCAGAAYTVSKWGVSGLTQNIAAMYEKDGIRCNAVAPGGVKTNVAGDFKSQLAAERIGPRMGATMPKMATPDLLAKAICFLADDNAAEFVNGVVLPVDGGWSVY